MQARQGNCSEKANDPAHGRANPSSGTLPSDSLLVQVKKYGSTKYAAARNCPGSSNYVAFFFFACDCRVLPPSPSPGCFLGFDHPPRRHGLTFALPSPLSTLPLPSHYLARVSSVLSVTFIYCNLLSLPSSILSLPASLSIVTARVLCQLPSFTKLSPWRYQVDPL